MTPSTKLIWAAAAAAIVIIVGIYILTAGGGPGRMDAGDPVLVAEGKAVYGQHCASCHGARLEGQPNWRSRGPDGMLPAPPHNATGHTWHHPDRLLFDITRNGRAANMSADYRSNMPAFRDILTDRQIWAALSYIKSRWPAQIRARQEYIDSRAR